MRNGAAVARSTHTAATNCADFSDTDEAGKKDKASIKISLF